MSPIWLWLILAVLCLGVEILTGTLALLFAAIGAVAAAVVAGVWETAFSAQWALFGIGSMVGTLIAWRRMKDCRKPEVDLIDLQQATVISLPDSGGIFRVTWRDAEWDARLENQSPAQVGDKLKLLRQHGNTLILQKIV